jgi:Ras-related protein Rab-18
MERWFEEAESNAMPGAVMYLVGSKLDKTSGRVVKSEEGQELADKHGCQFCEVSSKTRENVRKPFVEIVDAIVKDPKLLSANSRRSGTVSVGGAGAEAGGCSC